MLTRELLERLVCILGFEHVEVTYHEQHHGRDGIHVSISTFTVVASRAASA